MKPAGTISTIGIAVSLLLGACGATTGGPQAWIDAPLDNTTVPLAPLTITAHASAAGGVSSIEFTIDDQSIQSVPTGGNRLEWKAVEWTPPGPGTYRVGARGVGNDGATGPLATSMVTVSGEAGLPVPIPGGATATPLTPTVTVTPVTVTPITPGAPAAPGVVGKMNANCREGPATSWGVYGNLMEGQRADLKGRLADNSWLLVHLVGRSLNCWIATSVVDVQGDLDEVAVVSAPLPPVAEEPPPADQPAEEEPPEVDVIEPEPIEVDTTPPNVAATTVDRQTMSCSQTVTSTVIALDDGGVSSVYATWEFTGVGGSPVYASGNKTYGLTNAAWHSYEATFGPLSGCAFGTLHIYGTAEDTAGLTTDFSQTVGITGG
jgi:uncharacterized protein YraI